VQIIFIILTAGFFTKAASQPIPPNYSGWFFQNPLPTVNILKSVRFINAKTGFAVGANNIIKTSNGGANWFLDYGVISQFYSDLNSVFFVYDSTSRWTDGANNYTGYAAGWTGDILKTTNFGVSWFRIQQGIGAVGCIFFNGPDTGYLADGNIIKKTTNGGASWVNLNTGTTGFSKLYFINSNTGYAVGWPGRIAKTTNAGNNWSLYSAGQQDFNAVHFPASDTGYILTQLEIYKTTNAGLNWFKPVYSLNRGGATDLYFTNSGTGYVVGGGLAGGYVLKTTNGGASWFVSWWNDLAGLLSITFVNQLTGYAVGGGGDILHTSDAGASWVNQKRDIADCSHFWTVEFVSENTGYAGAQNGVLAKTTDGGANWFRQVSNTVWDIEAIQFLNSETGYAIGDSQIVRKTTNGGTNWLTLNAGVLPAYSSFYSLHFMDTETGYIAGGNPGECILKTTNGGNNWIKQHESTGTGRALFAIRFIDANTGYAAGLNQWFYRTTNAGLNWDVDLQLQFNCPGCAFFKIKFVNSSTGFMVGHPIYSSGPDAVYRTTNSGFNWTRINIINAVIGAYSVAFTDENTGYICGWEGITKTTNGGYNWYYLNRFTNYALFDIDFTGVNTGYAVGSFGTIIKTTTGGGNYIGIKPVSNSVPVKYHLYQNYPNPFNPSTNIKFELPKQEFVTIKIFDVMGREVASLVNETKEAGYHSIVFNGADLSSGLYIYKIEAGDFTDTKKMILIK
jgi:photosystem II stability/assembly factor-like uncharacterized protein